MKTSPSPIRIERLARTAKADNWLHAPRRRRLSSDSLVLIAVALHALVVVAGLGALSWFGVLR